MTRFRAEPDRPYTMPPLVWGQADLSAAAGAPQPWLWQGFLAPGAVTLLTTQWKAGKTTLAAVLLARLKAGGELAGLPLAAGGAVVASEEPPGTGAGGASTSTSATTSAGSASRSPAGRTPTSGGPSSRASPTCAATGTSPWC